MTPRRKPAPPVRYEQIDLKRKFNVGDFSEEEDMQLLTSLIKYGPLDMPQLCKAIPTRSEMQIKQRMATLQKKAQASLTTISKKSKYGSVTTQTRDKVALDKWLDIVEMQHKNNWTDPKEPLPVHILSRAMGFIAKYEDHPKGNGKVNFKSIYEFLECMLIGVPSKRLSVIDSKFLMESLQRLSLNMELNDLSKETSFLTCARPKWSSETENIRTYGRKKEQKPHDRYTQFLSLKRFNPLCVPDHWLARKLQISKADLV